MAMDVRECDDMTAACTSADVKLQIGFMRRYDETFMAARQRIESGEIGDVVLVKSLTHGPSVPQEWMYDIRKSNGPLAEVNSHDIDTLRWFAGSEITEVYAIGGNFRCPQALERYPDFYDNVAMVCRFADGRQGFIDGAVSVGYGYDSRTEIIGTKGIMFVGRSRGELGCRVLHGARYLAALRQELAHPFHGGVCGGGPGFRGLHPGEQGPEGPRHRRPHGGGRGERRQPIHLGARPCPRGSRRGEARHGRTTMKSATMKTRTIKTATMRAALLFGKEDLRVEELPLPQIADGEILLRVQAAAICGTDIRMYRNGARGVGPDSPLVLGHEVSGIIERVGAGVAGYREGMRVAVAPNMGCGVCDMCVSGNTQLCATYKAFGINIPGAFAQYMKIPEAAVRQGNLAEIPEGADFIDAALVEPLSCVYNAFKRTATTAGDTVLVIGAGPIGLMHAKLALMGGAARVYMNDISAERLELCTKAEPSIIPVSGGPLVERMKELTGGRGVDVCITAAPVPEIQVAALEVAAVNGRVMFFGGLPGGKKQGGAGHEPRALQADHDIGNIALEPQPVSPDTRPCGLGSGQREGPRHIGLTG